MIVYSGLGFLVFGITFGVALLLNFQLDARFGDGYYSSHVWAIGTSLVVGGLVSAAVGFALKKRSDRVVVDAKTGERLVLSRSSHRFFFVPMHWAGLAVAVIGGALVIRGML